MEQIIMVKPDGSTYPLAIKRTATKISSAKQTMQLLGDDVLNITVVSPFPQTYGIGDKTTVFGRVYKINQLPKVKKNGMREFSYDLTLEGIQYDLLRACYDLTIDTTNNTLQDVQADTLTGDLNRFATVLISNANRVFPNKWVIGTCPDSETKTITFSESDNCLSVLQNLCQESNFDIEFEIAQNNGVNTINFKKVGQVFPYTFKFGKSIGIYTLDRQNVSSSSIVTRLKVYGSSDNITSKYRAKRLCLPGKSKAQSYIENATAIAKYGVIEGKKFFDYIKPTFKGTITSLVSGSVVKFVDTSMFDLNAKETDGKTTKYLLDGVSAKIHFNTGNLAGYEFEVKAYDHATHTFTLAKQTDNRGDSFPSESSVAFQFAKGNEYKILDVALPESYELAAESELLEDGTTYYQQNSQPKVKYGLTLTKAFLEKQFGSDGTTVNIFVPGDYIPVKDADIDVDKSIRIQSFVRDLLDEYNYTLTISDTVTTTTINRVISDLIDIDKIININDLKDPARAKANWRTSREVLNMVFDPDGDYYTDKIKPNSIDTMCLSVGAKSMQFGLQNTSFQPNFQGNANVVKVTGGVLTHYTIVEDGTKSWELADNQTTLNENVAFYIYAKCSKTGTSGSIIFSKQAIKVEEDASNYHFLIGVLNSVDPTLNVRSIYLQYGFTTINGRFIKTGRVESADGLTYFDLDNGEIGGRIVFTRNGDEKTLEELGQEALENKDFINNTLSGVLDGIEKQIDGKIETWFQAKDPSEEWNDASTLKKHIGDIWYNTQTQQCKHFSAKYSWETIKDIDAINALTAASNAQDTADGKRRVFVDTPYPPYDVGDLWAQGEQGELMRCIKARQSGSYVSNDWGKAANYMGNVEFANFVTIYNDTINNIYNQLDGQIEQFFYEIDPLPASLEDYEEMWQNAPANTWNTITEKEKHLGDLYYNTKSGKVWRWIKAGEADLVFYWKMLQDTEVSQALALANDALTLAGNKRRVFVDTPYPPYDVGDLWAQGEQGELMRCFKARQSGSYVSNDWGKASNYTDDSALTTFIDGAYTDAVNSITKQIDGKVESWFQSTDPAEDWVEYDEMKRHKGDMWYNITAKTLWIWQLTFDDESGSFMYGSWRRINDADALAAYETASNAQDTADGKRRVFVDTPYPPYDVGDLWAQGEQGELMRCIKARQSGTYVSADWRKAAKYTDDSALNNFVNNVYNEAVNSIIEQIDGKVETWFQTSDPAAAWNTVELKDAHIGDMWYNATANELKYYTTAYKWEKINDADALAAYETASNAQDTADGKRRVFVDTPYPPYDVGDLWVNGTDLRRCATAQSSSGSYNVNDWVTCVAYDNTKTVIDGGLVTSGTIQVAGSESTILAGMTGQGTAAESIRFWAGASFENRATAPFRVMQDGSVVMTKAKVEGIIDAISGTIGGFEIASGRIGNVYGSDSGLSLYNNFIRFLSSGSGRKYAAIGDLGIFGYDNLAHFDLSSDSTYDTLGSALFAKCRAGNGSMDYRYPQRALEISGNVYGSGKNCFFEEGYIGQAYTDSITTYFKVTHKYHFTANTTSYLYVNLPTKTQIENVTGKSNIIFDVEIVCDRSMDNRLKIKSQTGAQMHNNDGNAIDGLDMERGDVLILRYYNGGYMCIQKNYSIA